jgi:predicted peroxiredoxin
MNDKLLIVLSHGTDNPNKSTRALHLAKVAKENGKDVKIFLLDDAVFIAKKGVTDNLRSATGDIAADLMTFLEDFEVPIFACTPCAKARGIKEEDLVKNAKMATAIKLITMTSNHPVISL